MEPFNELDFLKKILFTDFFSRHIQSLFSETWYKYNAFRRISYKIVCFMVRDDATLQFKVRFS